MLLSGCQTATPEEVTMKFWQALAQSNIENAKTLATANSQRFVNLKEIDSLSTIQTGEVITDELTASVLTTISRNKKAITFNTVLLNEDEGWKVDFQQTHTNIAMLPFEGIAKSLEQLGDSFVNQLEDTVPLIEKEIESLGNELKGQIDEFGRTLKKPQTPNKPKAPPGTI